MKDFHHLGVLAVAQTLHGVTTGAVCGIPAEETHRMREWLLERVANWKIYATKSTEAFDTCVKGVCIVALHEFENWVPR